MSSMSTDTTNSANGSNSSDAEEEESLGYWRAVMSHELVTPKHADSSSLYLSSAIETRYMGLEWVRITEMSEMQNYSTDVPSVIMSCISQIPNSDKNVFYSRNTLYTNTAPTGFSPRLFERWLADPNRLSLLQFLLSRSLVAIGYTKSYNLDDYASPQADGDDGATQPQSHANDMCIAPVPSQLETVSNEAFYKATFRAKMYDKSAHLQRLNKAVLNGMVVACGDTCILKTYSTDQPYCYISNWELLLQPKHRIKTMGEGSFNRVFLVSASQHRIAQDFAHLLQVSDEYKGCVVIRESKEQGVAFSTIKEIYLTAYASYYQVGPQLLASYYIGDLHQVRGTYSASAAWDGNCDELLTRVQKVHNNVMPSDFCEKFCELFLDLAKRAANVGLFHGDLKPQNMLFCMKKDWKFNLAPLRMPDSIRTAVAGPGNSEAEAMVDAELQLKKEKREDAIDSLKLCMTDFDEQFCAILTPEDRKCSKECIIVASVCMLLGYIRCFHGDNMWSAMRDAMEGMLAREIVPNDTCSLPGNNNGTLCEFLKSSLFIEKKSIDRIVMNAKYQLSVASRTIVGMRKKLIELKVALGDHDARVKELEMQYSKLEATKSMRESKLKYAEERQRVLKKLDDEMLKEFKNSIPPNYTGQKLVASKRWQRHVGHYMTKGRYLTDPMDWVDCLQLTHGDTVSVYERVVQYALKDDPLYKPRPGAWKRTGRRSPSGESQGRKQARRAQA